MGYRSLKRVLGETNLERKCRFLFGTCLLALLGASFYAVDYVAEKLVIDTTRGKARDLVDVLMLQAHFKVWATKPEEEPFVQQLITDLQKQEQNYRYQIVTLPGEPQLQDINDRIAEDGTERAILERLKAEFVAQTRAQAAEGVEPPGTGASPQAVRPHIFGDRKLPSRKEYHYYEPVRYAKGTCTGCHDTLQGVGSLSLADLASDPSGRDPFHAVQIIIPYKETKDAINQVRAILIALAIATVFLAMLGLYVIVRYVIVKPLNHLRDVSDEISRGNTELRAEIHTNDEFEELATAFNRMLRHLTDAQWQLQQVNQDLDAKVDQLAQLNMRLYEMNRLKDDFLANMSHELRTPLNSIIGFSEVLQGIDSLNDKQKRYAQNIQKSGRILLDMINDILDLAKMEAGKMDVRPSEFRIDTVVMAQCDMVRSLTEEKNIDLECRVPPDLPPLFQDQSKVQQVLTNLLSNAIKFTPEGGRITVAAAQTSDQDLELTVADTGVGIPEEDREVVFEKFRQSKSIYGADGLTRAYSGTGLGLSIVKELCKLLGGEISFESELGRGSTFKVVLPWQLTAPTRLESRMSAKLSELSKPKRSDFGALSGTET